MDWAARRKIIYSIIFALLAIALVSYPTFKIFYTPSSCTDQKQNGSETGVDCGGGCNKYCPLDVAMPRVVWAKAFSTGAMTYDLGAYIENPNKTAGLKTAHFTMRMLDGAGNDVGLGEGASEIPPGSAILLFLPNIPATGTPETVQIEFRSDDMEHWVKATAAPEVLSLKNQTLRNTDTRPRLDATVVNSDRVNDVGQVLLNAIIYDAAKNPIAVSQTYLDGVPRGGEGSVVFTWQNRFTKNPRGGMCATPVDTVLLLDRSTAMNVGNKKPIEPLTSAKAAALSYVEAAELKDKVSLISFAEKVSSPIEHELSLDVEAIKKAISGIAIAKTGSQNINLGDALKGALSELASPRHTRDARSAIILLSAGKTNRPLDPINPKNTNYAKDYAGGVATDARKEGVEIYAVGLGGALDESFLRDMVATSPAHYFKAEQATDLEAIYAQISQSVCKEESFIKDIMVFPRTTFSQ